MSKAKPEISMVDLKVRLRDGSIRKQSFPLADFASICTAAHLYNSDEQKVIALVNIDLKKENSEVAQEKLQTALESFNYREEEILKIQGIEELWK